MITWPSTKAECEAKVSHMDTDGRFKGVWAMNTLPIPVDTTGPDTTSSPPTDTWTVTLPSESSATFDGFVSQSPPQSCPHCEPGKLTGEVVTVTTLTGSPTTLTIVTAAGDVIDETANLIVGSVVVPARTCTGSVDCDAKSGQNEADCLAASTTTTTCIFTPGFVVGEAPVSTPGAPRAAPTPYVQFAADGAAMDGEPTEGRNKALLDAVVGELASGLTGASGAIHSISQVIDAVQTRVTAYTTQGGGSPVGTALQEQLQAKGCLEDEKTWPDEWN